MKLGGCEWEKKKAMSGRGRRSTVFFSFPIPPHAENAPGASAARLVLCEQEPMDYALKSWQVNSVTQAKPLISSRDPPPLTAQRLTGARCSSSATLADEIMTQ